MNLPAFIANSVKRKTTAMVLVTAFVTLALNALALLAYDSITYRSGKLTEARTQVEILSRAASPAIAFDDLREAQAVLATLNARGDFVEAALYKADGRRFASLTRDPQAAPLLFERLGANGIASARGDLLLTTQELGAGGQNLGTVALVTRLSLLERVLAYVGILVAVMALALAATVPISAWLQRAVTEPILAIDAAAHSVIERGDFTVRARRTTDDETGVLADAFNRMLDEVQAREEALRLADKRKDEFLATLSHELRNPLAPVRNAVALMEKAPDNAQVVQEARKIIARQTAQMVRLIDDLLDVSRITTGKLVLKRQVVDAGPVLLSALEAVEPMARSRSVTLEVDLPGEPVLLNADATRLEQVVLNLLNNAVKFSEPGGRVFLHAEARGGELRISVRDEGIGIAPGQIDSIFEMFSQADQSLERKTSGLGVGLALARRLAELHGGTVDGSSGGSGKGASFVVRLPIGDVAATDGLPSAITGSRKGGTRVLVVDDNRDYAQTLAVLLKDMADEVRVEHDGIAGLAAAAQFVPDVAFVDIGMPGLNGFELAMRLRASPATRNTLLVAVTGYGQPADRDRGVESGFDVYLVKPVDVERLRDILGGGLKAARQVG